MNKHDDSNNANPELDETVENKNSGENSENIDNSKKAFKDFMKDNFDVDVNLDDLPASDDIEKNESAEPEAPVEEGEPAKKKAKRTRKVSVKDLGEDAQILPIEDFLPPKLNIIPMAGHPMFPGILCSSLPPSIRY